MQFDYSYDRPWPASLPASHVEMARKAQATARDAGLAVQFVNATGNLDEFSFATIAQRDAFIAANLIGKPYALSA